mmetsp:Transcript_6648/g.16509  ORF Transcript_6648/g.16509 Transcript_6648/m.16509 type:complete len:244 (+) Transcript_6648:1686-2417(+)
MTGRSRWPPPARTTPCSPATWSRSCLAPSCALCSPTSGPTTLTGTGCVSWTRTTSAGTCWARTRRATWSQTSTWTRRWCGRARWVPRSRSCSSWRGRCWRWRPASSPRPTSPSGSLWPLCGGCARRCAVSCCPCGTRAPRCGTCCTTAPSSRTTARSTGQHPQSCRRGWSCLGATGQQQPMTRWLCPYARNVGVAALVCTTQPLPLISWAGWGVGARGHITEPSAGVCIMHHRRLGLWCSSVT